MQQDIHGIAFIGNYMPRQCGIATFTTDICEAVAQAYPDSDVFAVPMNDIEEGYKYPPRVRFEVADRDLAAYRRAAEFLNISNVDIACVQHEFGIYGGAAGSHLLKLLSELRMPVVTTLHTVLKDPGPAERRVMDELIQLSDRLIVMSERGKEFLLDVHQAPAGKIDLIPHGIPDVPFVDPNYHKDKFGVEGKTVLLTFGLLAPNKGVEYVIEALPRILETYPDTVYIILGATHPNLKREQGESYRLSLQRLVQARKVQGHVIFHNRFVSIDELNEFIGAADIYITPYLNQAQITSGTLAYTVGAGKAIVSTPYWYAEELLAEDRGVVVPFRDSDAIAREVIALLETPTRRHAMRKRAYQFGREMVWPQVAQRYMESFERARAERFRKPRGIQVIKTLDRSRGELPPVNLNHLRRMTDDTGILRHAGFSIPDYNSGYATDDNARALVLTILLDEAGGEPAERVRPLATRYLAFLNHAWDDNALEFRRVLGYNRAWFDRTGSEETQARALWALGAATGRSQDPGLRGLAGRLFEEALSRVASFSAPRAWAHALFGIMDYLRRFYGHRIAQQIRLELAGRLLALFEQNATDDWCWFENQLTTENACLAHALILCGQWLGDNAMLETGMRSLEWLVRVQRAGEEHFVPIGADGGYARGGKRARFDQRPAEAGATVAACLEAYRMTGEERWWDEAQCAFEWFLGRNDLQTPLYNPTTGGCCDALGPDRVNQNQGAEAVLSFLLSLVEMNLAEHVIEAAEAAPPRTVDPVS